MAKDIVLETGMLSSRIIRGAQNELHSASGTLNALKHLSDVTYQAPEGYCKVLFQSDVFAEIASIAAKIANLENRLEGYAQILQIEPQNLVDMDENRKNALTMWWERTGYLTEELSLDVYSGATGFFSSLFLSAKEQSEREKAADGYTAGGGGYSKQGGGKGSFGSAESDFQMSCSDKDNNILADSWNDLNDFIQWIKDHYNDLSKEEQAVIKEIAKEQFEEYYSAIDITIDIVSGDVSWDTAKTALKAIGIGSTEVSVIVETCELVLSPDGTMAQLQDEYDYYMDRAIKDLSSGNVETGIWNVGKATATGLFQIGYGVAEVSTELVSGAIKKSTEGIITGARLVGNIIPGAEGTVICGLADGVETVTDAVCDFVSGLFK